MLREIKYFLFTITVIIFIFFTATYYFSETNKKNSYRSLNQIDSKIKNYTEKLPLLEDNTKNIIEYTEQLNNKKKKFNFWKLLELNE